MRILALDPGHVQTAWLVYDTETKLPVAFATEKNTDLIHKLHAQPSEFLDCPVMCVEWISSYGMQVGQEVFLTCLWAGRFVERWPKDHELIIRPDIKVHLCGNRSAKDKFVREALIHKFGACEAEAIGKKATPGPLYGISGDTWSALAVAIYWAERRTL